VKRTPASGEADTLAVMKTALPLASALCAASLAAVSAPPAPTPPPPDPVEASVTALTKVSSAWSPSLSPDGKKITFVSDASGQPQAWIVPAEGGAPVRLVTTTDPVLAVEWSPGGQAIAYVVAPGGGTNTQVWLAASDGSGPKRLTDGGTEMNRLGPFRADGKVLAIASNRRYRTWIDAWLCDVASGSLSLVAETRGDGGVADISRDGKKLLLERAPRRGFPDLYLVDLANKSETLLTPRDTAASFSARFSPDGKAAYLATNAGRERAAFGRIDLSGPTPGPIEILAAREDADLASFVLDEAGKKAVLLWNAAERSELSVYDIGNHTLSPAPALPGDVASGLSLSKDGRILALAVTGAALPSDIWTLDLGTGRFLNVTKSAHDGVDLGTLVRPELVKIPSFDAKSLPAWLYRARGTAGPGPLVLSFHGGPGSQERPVFRPEYQALLARGISVLAPNVRGSGGFGRTFLGLDDQGKRVDVLRDVKACRDWAVERKLADPARVGIMGTSYGGWVTVAELTLFPDDFAAGADLSGIVDLPRFFAETEPWMAEISKEEYGDPGRQAELLKNLSPLYKLHFIRAPLLVMHGRNDTIVLPAQSTRLVEGLKARNVPVEFVLLPDEGHGVRRLPNRIRANLALVRWFGKYLEAPPTK
jgi:dipeptidyl aminopeptidase/acylaminoacyl peptidase